MFDYFRPNPKPTKTAKKSKRPLPKHSKKWKPADKKQKQRMALLKSVPCCACGAWDVEIHHITDCGRRIGHDATIPLCVSCHRTGEVSIGRSKSTFVETYGTELELLARVNKMYKLD